ncbi:Acetyltransferase [Rickettsia akari str. Hartford]|uniref:Acetyltransferase n=1 Tax=Rickettsia akari (strain Hartford) TaxID=293614 RepID=A8GP82_RICAH|nr:Acetyltransferase [Rickettsia akari str. Hartford]
MDFQSKPFYEKLGYKLEFTRYGYTKDSIIIVYGKIYDTKTRNCWVAECW